MLRNMEVHDFSVKSQFIAEKRARVLSCPQSNVSNYLKYKCPEVIIVFLCMPREICAFVEQNAS